MPLNETAINYLAYRYASSGDNLVFGYECDSVRGINAFFIQTGEPYQAVSGDKGVQTILVINGESLEVRGALQDRGGAQLGFDHHLVKPVSPEAVLGVVAAPPPGASRS